MHVSSDAAHNKNAKHCNKFVTTLPTTWERADIGRSTGMKQALNSLTQP